jgi:hypothetical protein
MLDGHTSGVRKEAGNSKLQHGLVPAESHNRIMKNPLLRPLRSEEALAALGSLSPGIPQQQ